MGACAGGGDAVRRAYRKFQVFESRCASLLTNDISHLSIRFFHGSILHLVIDSSRVACAMCAAASHGRDRIDPNRFKSIYLGSGAMLQTQERFLDTPKGFRV